ncbi:ankyrin repeat domain-containing protein, partial [Klebsiella pneumoniae]|uniref:ankyrin repeat domain-containing protein n=1 Tax=Klebsiella pneumoniae TaxID=573 RepID=UPI0034DEAE8F
MHNPRHDTEICLTRLLQATRAVNVAECNGITPIHFAASISERHVRRLLQAGADVFASTKEMVNVL